MENQTVDYASPPVMAQTLIATMRNIGMRVRLDDSGALSVGPSRMVWESDREIIKELKEHMILALQAEQGIHHPVDKEVHVSGSLDEPEWISQPGMDF